MVGLVVQIRESGKTIMAASAENRWAEPKDRDVGREPCPDRIVEDLGGAFGMGCIGGFIWHYIKVG